MEKEREREWDSYDDVEMEGASTVASSEAVSMCCDSNIHFEDLPVEIHEAILDHLFGERISLVTAGLGMSSWAKALRHPRRKDLSNLALILPIWRSLVQERIYRHSELIPFLALLFPPADHGVVKLKGTIEGLEECSEWFLRHPHLAAHVRHVEFWVPVWGNRANRVGASQFPPIRRYNYNNEDVGLGNAHTLFQATMAWNSLERSTATNELHHYASHNASLQDMFEHVKVFFPRARILTIEGGHCKKPPMVRQFRKDPLGRSGQERLEVLPNIQTFVMRGAWNIMREYQHWCNISLALPNLREWQCTYEKPKLEAYNTIGRILLRLPPTLQHVNIGLEGFFTKEHIFSVGDTTASTKPHMCTLLGHVAPRLESLSFTGKLCSCLFDRARTVASTCHSAPTLKSIDIVVKSCCCERAPDGVFPSVFDDPTSITNMNFIRAFEQLTIAGVRCLDTCPDLNYVRIRFIDLDSACPLLNPYFHLANNRCTGLWSAGILDALHESRPKASFVELSDGIYPQYNSHHQVVGAVYPRSRPQSIQAATYKIIADASKL